MLPARKKEHEFYQRLELKKGLGMTQAKKVGEHERLFPAGHIIFEQDDPGSRMYIIKKGNVRIYRRIKGEEVVLAHLGAGEFFGEMALLEELPRSASAIAEKATLTVEVDAPVFVEMVKSNAEIAVRMMRKLASRVRDLDRRFQNLYADPSVGRALEILSFMLPADGERDLKVPIEEVRKAVIEKTGVLSVELRRVFSDLVRAGCIRFDRFELVVTSRKDLQEYATYLDLRGKYEAAEDVMSDVAQRGMGRLLRALEQNDKEVALNQSVLAKQYQGYLNLKAKFN
ncbi:MAG: Crp/Fnr family transcriptional regulator [Deltaproteobacteria bacterium]|nr:Crp/Fnr family transcriptional regulator [Deltaproteobacteria bacterium]